MATEDNAVTLASELCNLCTSGRFTLTKWMNHSRKVLMSIPEEHIASEMKDLDLSHDPLPIDWTLGILWETDTFTFSLKLLDKPTTRSGILSIVNSIYDPLGFFASWFYPLSFC